MSASSEAMDPDVSEHASTAAGGRRLVINALAGGGANVLKIGVQLVMLPLMARLLGPAEFGLYALALPTISFCMILADGGLAASLAREPLESRLVWSTAFWLVLGVGLALAGVVIAGGAALEAISHAPGVSHLMDILSISLVMISLAALPSARLTREARLTVLAGADLASTLIGAAVAIFLAFSGYGAKSLAVQYVVYHTLRSTILNFRAFVRPSREFSFSAISSHLSIGAALLGVKISDFFGRMVENVLYGRAFGPGGLGVYTFANQAPRFICEAASGPIWAALFAFSLRESAERLEVIHVKLVRLLSSLIFPVAALLSATAPDILLLLLGPRWAEAGALLQLLAPFYAFNVVSGQTGAVLIAKGRGWLLFWWSAFLTTGRVAAVALGPWIGQTGVAAGVDLTIGLYGLALFAVAGHRHAFRRLLDASIWPMIAATAAGSATLAVNHLTSQGLEGLIIAWSVGGAIYILLLGLMQFDDIRTDLDFALTTIGAIKRARRPAH